MIIFVRDKYYFLHNEFQWAQQPSRENINFYLYFGEMLDFIFMEIKLEI